MGNMGIKDDLILRDLWRLLELPPSAEEPPPSPPSPASAPTPAPSWCKHKSGREKLERQRQYQFSIKAARRPTTDKRRRVPTCGAFSGGTIRRRNVTSGGARAEIIDLKRRF